MTWKLQSAIVPVTGAASGIGLAICRMLHAEGATPLLLDRDPQRLEAAAREVHGDAAAGARHAYAVDVRDSRAVDACLDAIARDHGAVTHAVASAGTAASANVLSVTDAQWHRVIDVNLHGVMYFGRAAARQMAPAGRGSIVAIASVAGLGASRDLSSYVASKAAVINLMRAFAVDLGGLGIRANAVAPGVIDTPMQEGNRASFDAISAGLALPRIGTAEEVAQAALFLLSDLSSYITGHTIVVDGGMTARYR